MKKTILIAAAVLVTGAPRLHAQQDLTKQVEVTRAYTPRVGRADKLPVKPDMTDTVRLRPDIEYSITSVASATSFATRPIGAASVAEERAAEGYNLYLRAGAAVPTGSQFDVYFKPRMAEGRALGVFGNHRGSYSRITNDLGVKSPAMETADGGGLWFTRAWERRRLEVDATYDRRTFRLYGVSPMAGGSGGAFDNASDRVALGLGRVGVRLGDPFADLSRLNFSVGVDGGYAHGSGETRFDAHVKLARMFGDGTNGFELTVSERGAFGDGGGGQMAGETNVVVAFEPRYLLRVGRLGVRLGVDARYMRSVLHWQNRVGVAPSVELRYDTPSGAFVPFLSYTSHTVGGDHEALSRLNPYVMGSGDTEWVNDARVGFEGDVGGVFHYRVSGGASIFRDHQLLIGEQHVSGPNPASSTVGESPIYTPLSFVPAGVDGSRYTAGAELGVHDLGGFGARVWGEWNRFDFPIYADSSYSPVAFLPRYEAGTELSYRHGDSFSVRLGARFVGERDYLVHETYTVTDAAMPAEPFDTYNKGTLAPTVDVTLGADVRFARGMWAFVEGSNLANQRLYPYPHYRGLGANATLGVKLVF